MGGELVNSPASPLSYTEQFKSNCAFYMSIGMTYDEYWNEDCEKVIYYRRAYHLRQKRNNDLSWLIGRYVYDALNCVTPALRGLSKEPVEKYLEEPYPYDKQDVERAKKKKAEKQQEQFRNYVDALNQKRHKQEVVNNGNEHR